MLKFARRSRSSSSDRASTTSSSTTSSRIPRPSAAAPAAPAVAATELLHHRKTFQKTNTRDFSPSPSPKMGGRRTTSLERTPVKSRRQLNFDQQKDCLQTAMPPPPAPSIRHHREFLNPPILAARMPLSTPPPRPPVSRLRVPSLSPRSSALSDDSGHYREVSSGTLCRLAPLTPTLEKLSSAHVSEGVVLPNPPPKSVLKRGAKYDFHRAIERLVEKLDMQLMDTSSESGYGSEQEAESLNSVSLSSSTASTSTSSSSSSDSKSSSCASAPPPLPKRRGRRRVQFDSYVLLLQGLKERNLELVQANVREVCREAMATDEVALEFMRCVVDSEEGILREMLTHGFDANFADPAGLTPLHLAAAFNLLPVIKQLISHGAAVNARAHSSGHTPSGMCNPRVLNYEACQAYLRCMEECLGVANVGVAYAARHYRTCRSDELSVSATGERVRVQRKGDYDGSAWWWCENDAGEQGYVLKDLLTLNRPSCCSS